MGAPSCQNLLCMGRCCVDMCGVNNPGEWGKDNKWMNHWLITSKSVNFVRNKPQADDCEAMRQWTDET